MFICEIKHSLRILGLLNQKVNVVHLSSVCNESLSHVNILYGLPQELSYILVICTRKLQLVNKTHPKVMKEDAVCSLGGITIVNVKTLEQKKMLEKIVVSLTSF